MKRSVVSYIREFFDTYRENRYQLKPYLIRDGKPHPVAILCPGGGYRRVCSFVEGHPYAKKLNAMGYHAFVVYYRVNVLAGYPVAQFSFTGSQGFPVVKPARGLASHWKGVRALPRAVREIHSHAADWNLDMRGYSVWGSSAGGHLAASFGTENMGYSRYDLPKPGALILTYPVVTMGEKTHEGSRNFLLGQASDGDMVRFSSVERQITPAYPPTFLWWGSADSCVDPENSRMLRGALEAQNIPCQCIEYPGVEHGVGIGRGLACEGWIEKAVAFWEANR